LIRLMIFILQYALPYATKEREGVYLYALMVPRWTPHATIPRSLLAPDTVYILSSSSSNSATDHRIHVSDFGVDHLSQTNQRAMNNFRDRGKWTNYSDRITELMMQHNTFQTKNQSIVIMWVTSSCIGH
jgi:hypothetical protein